MVPSRRDLGRWPIFLEAFSTATSMGAMSILKVLYRRPGSLSGPALLLSSILDMTLSTSLRVMSPSQSACADGGSLRLRSCLMRVSAAFLSDGLSS